MMRFVSRHGIVLALAAVTIVAGLSGLPARGTVRVKDLTRIEGVRSNPLIGYGIVVGLQGTGDGTQAQFTIQSLANLLRRSGVAVPPSAIRVKNVAAVMVTAELPPFARPTTRIDVGVSSVGDAKSLSGGTLLMTPLTGPDGAIYAVAQGPVSLGGGFTAGGGGNGVSRSHPTSGMIPAGAVVERAVAHDGLLGQLDSFRLLLDVPDFETALRITDAVNDDLGGGWARAVDSATVRVDRPTRFEGDAVRLLARIEKVEVDPDLSARVVVNEKTGTVVMGQNVRISTVALAHGNLTIEIDTTLTPSQPAPFSEEGRTVVVPDREIYVSEGPNQILALQAGISVHELIRALNSLGVSPRDMVAILEAMRAAGALHAELVVM